MSHCQEPQYERDAYNNPYTGQTNTQDRVLNTYLPALPPTDTTFLLSAHWALFYISLLFRNWNKYHQVSSPPLDALLLRRSQAISTLLWADPPQCARNSSIAPVHARQRPVSSSGNAQNPTTTFYTSQ